MADPYDIEDLMGEQPSQAQALAQALRARQLAGVLNISGNKGLIASAQGMEQGANQDLQRDFQRQQQAPHLALQQEQLRTSQQQREALNSPQYRTGMESFLASMDPKLAAASKGAMPQTLEHLAALAERKYQADKMAQARMYGIDHRGTLGETDNSSVTAIADSIEKGLQPPDLKGMYRFGPLIKGELSKRGFDLSKAQTDWSATQRHVATLNGPQQTRLRQAVGAASDQLDNVEKLYEDWRAVGSQSGVRQFNRAAMAISKQLPGDAGASAQALEGQIALLTGEMGNVLMGGASPTDHSLELASKMLAGDWNEEQFKKAIKQMRIDLKIRQNSLAHSTPAGVAGNNPYDKQPKEPAKPGSGEAASPTSGAKEVKTKAERDALPPGTQYTRPGDPTVYTKG